MKRQILCTLGPASLDPQTITRLTELRVDLFRLNLSHVDLDRLEEYVALIREHSQVPICFDTQGAQVRTGVFLNAQVELQLDSVVEVVASPQLGEGSRLPLYPDTVLDRHLC